MEHIAVAPPPFFSSEGHIFPRKRKEWKKVVSPSPPFFFSFSPLFSFFPLGFLNTVPGLNIYIFSYSVLFFSLSPFFFLSYLSRRLRMPSMGNAQSALSLLSFSPFSLEPFFHARSMKTGNSFPTICAARSEWRKAPLFSPPPPATPVRRFERLRCHMNGQLSPPFFLRGAAKREFFSPI